VPDSIEPLRAALAGRYDLDHELGAGGMAVVYLARDLRHERRVALKVLRPELGAVAGAERFNQEIRLAARLVHPHILPVLDSGAAADRLWYTMPYIEGESLRVRLDRERQLSLDEAVRLTGEIAEALGHAHAQHILHRDIKPENILLSGGHALVADFGIARALGEAGQRLTNTGIAIGTPGYMSPEQSSGEHELDGRSDLYALASVCYEMLAGEPPFTGPTAQAVIARRLSQPPPSLRTIRPNVPAALDTVLQRALATVPADRFASTAEFARALLQSQNGTLVATPRSGLRRRWPLVAAIALIVVAAGGLVLRDRSARPAGLATDSGGIRLAVLPFRMIGGDSGDRYLADGMTEEVASMLANLGGLRVLAQSSVTPLASGSRTPREIGIALRADALIDGDVQKAGDAVRVRVKLIDPATEESKWSQTYDHTASDILRIQSEVATKIASVLRIQLAARESRSLSRPPTTNPEAYDAYLRALAIQRAGVPVVTLASARLVIAELNRAVQLDPDFAAAWALLAANLVSAVFLFDDDSRLLDRADSAVRRALGLDSTLAMAWKARHDLEWNAVRGWHFAEALADVRHALVLQPSLVAAHNAIGALYFHYGFMEEARRELEASLSLDPRDSCDDPTRCTGFSRPRIARVLWYRQQFDSALAVYDRIPFLGAFVWEKAIVLNGVGRPADGLALLDSARRPGVNEPSDREAVRGLLYAALGRPAEAVAHIKLATVHADSRSHFHHAQFTIACAYARMGRKADAVEWLRKTAENGMPNYPLFRNDPNLRVLQGDPGYEAFMTGLRQQFEANGRLVGGASRPT
jgi:eukaryotic-like serine/threonine-protein kinase